MFPRKFSGQAFLLAGFLFLLLFAAGASVLSMQPQTDSLQLMESAADNIASEAPRALSLGLIEGSGIEGLADFSMFALNYSSGKGFEFSAFWVAALPDGSSVDVHAGNYLGEEKTLTIAVDSEERNVTISSGEYTSETFTPSGSEYILDVSYPGYSKSLSWPLSKANMHMGFSLSDGRSTIKRSVEG